MTNSWKTLKTIINNNGPRKDLLLTLIDEEGNICSANLKMVRTLHLPDPKKEKINLFTLLHPFGVSEFKKALNNCNEENVSFSSELYLKNGYYHPMKWQVNYLDKTAGKKKIYLCTGYKLLDDQRLHEFN